MNDEIKPIELLFLWRLAVVGGGDWLKEIKPDPKPAARKRLAAVGLIEQEKRKSPSGRGTPQFISLTDRGWGWLGDHLDADLSTKSPAGTMVLHKLLSRLKTFIDQNKISLGELVNPGPPPPPDDIEDCVTKAYYSLSGGQSNVRVRIADLRQLLSSIPRPKLDQALLDMASSEKAVLFRLDNPTEIHPEDRNAVLRTPTGEERHIMYLGRRGS
jgi:hypothetical protein